MDVKKQFSAMPVLLYWSFLFTPALVENASLYSWLLWAIAFLLFTPLLYFKPLRILAFVFLVVLGAVNLLHISFLGNLADHFFLATALRTNQAELTEFFGVIPAAWIALAAVWVGLAIFACVRIEKQIQGLAKKSWTFKAIKISSVIWCILLAFSLAKGYSFEQVIRKIKTVYPMHIVRAWIAQQQLSEALFYQPAVPASDATKIVADTVVVVIGESASAQRWSLLGYEGADTNGPLHGIEGLQAIRVMAHGLNTAAALPFMLTGMDAHESVAQHAPSFIDLSKAAGYKTFVFSNSRFFSNGEDFYSVALRRSTDVYEKTGNGEYDEILTEQLQAALADPAPRKLIVLHTYGSHFQVEQRYPTSHALFADVYDNSIHYTSSLLAQWIDLLKESAAAQQKVALVYSSDHGVAMPPCAQGYLTGAGLSSLQVPLLIWSNDTALVHNIESFTADEALHVKRSNAEFAEFVANSVGYSLNLPSDSAAKRLLYNFQPWVEVQKLNMCTLAP